MATLIVLIVIAAVVLITLAQGIRIVPQARAGIVERLGRYHRTLDAGLGLVIRRRRRDGNEPISPRR